MGTLRKIFVWFRDSQTPRTRAARAVRAAAKRAIAADDDLRSALPELRAPHYYAFYYPKGREPGTGWAHPKMYVGPVDTREDVEDEIAQSWPRRAGEPRSRFKVKRLTADQFEKIWGSPPGSAPTHYGVED